MRIGLVSSMNVDKDIDFNLNQIEKYAIEARDKKVDLICFGESFYMGLKV